MSRVHDNIRARCKERNISVTALEKKAGVANGLIGKWKESEPNIVTLRKVAAALDCTIDDLIEE